MQNQFHLLLKKHTLFKEEWPKLNNTRRKDLADICKKSTNMLLDEFCINTGKKGAKITNDMNRIVDKTLPDILGAFNQKIYTRECSNFKDLNWKRNPVTFIDKNQP